MMDGTILGQGNFISDGTATTIMIPSGVDWLKIYNFTQSAASASANGFQFYWQLGMPNGQGTVLINTSGAVTSALTANNAFTIYDPSIFVVGALNNGSTGVTGFTAANPAVVTVGSTTSMSAGNIVIFSSLNNQPQFNGIPFSVGYGTLNSTHFSVDYLNATGTTPSTSGNFRVLPGMPLFAPRRRIITEITAAAEAVITLSVDHDFTIGQEIRLSFQGGSNSSLWGQYGSLDGMSAIIVDTNNLTGNGNNTITINVNTTGFGTFLLPNTALPYTFPQVIPFGEDTATALEQFPQLSSLDDATVNTGFIGMTLAAGADLPAGEDDDVIFWVAGKSTYGGS
jgi:hypothetical protein